MISTINAGNGAGTWEWETAYTIITFKSGNMILGTQDISSGTATPLTTISNLSNTPVSPSYGWSFAGWAISAGTTTAVYMDGAEITLNADTTLYAIYSRNVAFKYYDSATATGIATAYQTQYYYNTDLTTAAVSAVSTYPLYTNTLLGWSPLGWSDGMNTWTLAAAQTGAATTTLTPDANRSNVTYYAQYQRDAKITYAAGGGSGTAPADSTCVQRGNAGGLVTDAEVTIAANTFVRGGYTFDNWDIGGAAYEPGRGYAWAPALSENPVIQATARWLPIEVSGTADPANPDSNNDGYGDNISFSVPSSITYVVTPDGSLMGPDSASIQNHGSFEIRVSSVDVDAVSPFSIVPYAGTQANAVDLSVGPAGNTLSASDCLSKAAVPDVSAWHVSAASGTTPGSMSLSTSGHVGPLLVSPLSSTGFAKIQWYVKAAA